MLSMRSSALAGTALLALVALAAGGACQSGDRSDGHPAGLPPGEGGNSSSGNLPSSSSGSASSSSSSSGSGGEDAIIDPEGPCDDGLSVGSTDPEDAAAAAGICKQAVTAGDWGLVEARWARADGSTALSSSIFHLGHGLLDGFGDDVVPLEGQRLLSLSSGTARDPGDSGWQSPAGFDKGYSGNSPAGFPKESPACSGVVTGQPHDDVALEVTLRAPDSAGSLAFDFYFFTYEWPVYVCSTYNDFFVALLQPIRPGQTDANVSFDQDGNSVSVNNALVRVCECGGGAPCWAPPNQPQVSYDCELGAAELGGSGFEQHAATGWLTTRAPVEPGEEITLRWTVYDSGDGVLDSTVLIDGFRWLKSGEEDPITEPM